MLLNLILLYASGEEQVALFLIALSLALLVGWWGSKRRIGFGWAFLLALINLFIGIIAVLCSSKKDKVHFSEVKKEDIERNTK